MALAEIEGILSPSLIAALRKKGEISASGHAQSEKQVGKKVGGRDDVEEEKLKWTQSLTEADMKRKRKGEVTPFDEWRFGLSGVLLSKTAEEEVEMTEAERGVEAEALFHHGDEAARAGYTLQELMRMARAAFAAQRTLAINTLAKVVSKAGKRLRSVVEEGCSKAEQNGRVEDLSSIVKEVEEQAQIWCMAVGSGLPLIAVSALDSDNKTVWTAGLTALSSLFDLLPPSFYSSPFDEVAGWKSNERQQSMREFFSFYFGPLLLVDASAPSSPISSSLADAANTLAEAAGYLLEGRYCSLFISLLLRAASFSDGSGRVPVEEMNVLDVCLKLTVIATTPDSFSAEGEAGLTEDEIAFSRLGSRGRHVPREAVEDAPAHHLSFLLEEDVKKQGDDLLTKLLTVFDRHRGYEPTANDGVTLITRILTLLSQSGRAAAEAVVRSGVADAVKSSLLIDAESEVAKGGSRPFSSRLPWAVEAARLWKVTASLALNWRSLEGMVSDVLQWCKQAKAFVSDMDGKGKEGVESRRMAAEVGSMLYSVVEVMCLCIRGIVLKEDTPAFPVSSGSVAVFIEGAMDLAKAAGEGVLSLFGQKQEDGQAEVDVAGTFLSCLSSSLHCLSSFHSLLAAINARAASLGVIGRDFVPKHFVSKGEAAEVTMTNVLTPLLDSDLLQALQQPFLAKEGDKTEESGWRDRAKACAEAAGGLCRLLSAVFQARPSLAEPCLAGRSQQIERAMVTAELMSDYLVTSSPISRLDCILAGRRGVTTSFYLRHSALIAYYLASVFVTTSFRLLLTLRQQPRQGEAQLEGTLAELQSRFYSNLTLLSLRAVTACPPSHFVLAEAIVSQLAMHVQSVHAMAEATSEALVGICSEHSAAGENSREARPPFFFPAGSAESLLAGCLGGGESSHLNEEVWSEEKKAKYIDSMRTAAPSLSSFWSAIFDSYTTGSAVARMSGNGREIRSLVCHAAVEKGGNSKTIVHDVRKCWLNTQLDSVMHLPFWWLLPLTIRLEEEGATKRGGEGGDADEDTHEAIVFGRHTSRLLASVTAQALFDACRLDPRSPPHHSSSYAAGMTRFHSAFVSSLCTPFIAICKELTRASNFILDTVISESALACIRGMGELEQKRAGASLLLPFAPSPLADVYRQEVGKEETVVATSHDDDVLGLVDDMCDALANKTFGDRVVASALSCYLAPSSHTAARQKLWDAMVKGEMNFGAVDVPLAFDMRATLSPSSPSPSSLELAVVHLNAIKAGLTAKRGPQKCAYLFHEAATSIQSFLLTEGGQSKKLLDTLKQRALDDIVAKKGLDAVLSVILYDGGERRQRSADEVGEEERERILEIMRDSNACSALRRALTAANNE
uniref:RPAP1 C-terminal domain-containing protein n=1 Tax=Palpitomonas bilix TaxID=652834 RepID=A0A7S3GK86_9EUKA